MICIFIIVEAEDKSQAIASRLFARGPVPLWGRLPVQAPLLSSVGELLKAL